MCSIQIISGNTERKIVTNAKQESKQFSSIFWVSRTDVVAFVVVVSMIHVGLDTNWESLEIYTIIHILK